MDPRRLREATRPEHEATEAAMPLMGPDLSAARYVDVLQRFYRLVNAWDSYAATSAPATYAALASERRRSLSLRHDLEHFGAPVDDQVSAEVRTSIARIIGGADAAQFRFLGVMYVLEGSTLGGRFIAEHIEPVLGLTPGEGDAFFRGYGERTVPMWREFQSAIRDVPEPMGDAVITAAKDMFALFQKTLQYGVPVTATHPARADVASY